MLSIAFSIGVVVITEIKIDSSIETWNGKFNSTIKERSVAKYIFKSDLNCFHFNFNCQLKCHKYCDLEAEPMQKKNMGKPTQSKVKQRIQNIMTDVILFNQIQANQTEIIPKFVYTAI